MTSLAKHLFLTKNDIDFLNDVKGGLKVLHINLCLNIVYKNTWVEIVTSSFCILAYF